MNNVNLTDVIVVLLEWICGIVTTGLAFFAILAILILVFNGINNYKCSKKSYKKSNI